MFYINIVTWYQQRVATFHPCAVVIWRYIVILCAMSHGTSNFHLEPFHFVAFNNYSNPVYSSADQ